MSYAEVANRFPPYWHRSEHSYSGDRHKYSSWLPIDPNYRIIEALSGGGRSFNPMFGPLIFERYVKDAEQFVCPSVEDSGFEWWHVGGNGGPYWNSGFTNWDPIVSWEEWMKGNRGTARYSSGTYCLRIGLYPRSKDEALRDGINAFMADNFHYHYPDKEDWEYDVIRQRHGTGVNVAYLDGHLEYRTDEIMFTENYPKTKYRPLSEESGSGNITQTRMWRMWMSFDDRL
jgi:prepilin-type processing-associated H-X9-DG protein